MSHASGLAASIRGADESTTFDLGGQSKATISTNIEEGFRQPLQIDEMIRITFVTGAGKQGRQKYDEGAAKAVTSALLSLGFVEDRGASAVHSASGAGGNEDGAAKASSSSTSSLLQTGSPEEMIALSPMKIFEDLVNNRCPSWSQKKGCNAAIAEIQKLVTDVEERLLQGTPLSDSEQELYDAVSMDSLERKHNKVRDLMHEQVETGQITEREKAQLISQVSERLDTVTHELATAETEDRPKKAEKLRQTKTKLENRKAMLTKISPLAPEPLKYETEILELRKELAPLIKLEEGAKGRLLSVKETQHLAKKDDISLEIAHLENESRGWFEDDASFEVRLEKSRKAIKSHSGKGNATSKGKATKTTAAKTKSATNAWVSAAAPRARTTTKKSAAQTSKPKTKGNVGGVFAAMMLDSDSD
ncbi:MAG: hypothetical protein SGARI_003388 [Bacillariaceae sp.]